ncbi:MAG TPA: hypothetical protein VKZ89_13140 [Thermobifida alba]|nr:hypothetical protein [Thermobifida alba]
MTGQLCGASHHRYSETLCTEPAGHYRPERDPHAGPLIIDGRERGGAAWDEPKDTRMTDRPSLQDLDAVPESARWCCAGNAEDCPLCDTALPYPWICPGHPDTPANRARIQTTGGDQTLDGLRQHAADVAQRTGLAVTVDPFHDQYAVTVTRPHGGGSHGGYNAAEVHAMLLGIRLAADRGPGGRPTVSPAVAALTRVEQLAARIEAGHPVQDDATSLAAAIRDAARTDREQP